MCSLWDCKIFVGYNEALSDGKRIGEEGKSIRKNDDWYAMGKLMFSIHLFDEREDVEVPSEMEIIRNFWRNVPKDVEVSDSHLDELKTLLKEADKFYDVVRDGCFHELFDGASDESGGSIPMTKKNMKGTGKSSKGRQSIPARRRALVPRKTK